MNHLLYLASFWSFLLLPPVLLVMHALFPKQLPRWGVAAILMGLGWLLLNVGTHFYYNYLDDLFRATPNPSQELIFDLSADGAKRIFTFLFGWLYSLIYFLPWLLVYGVVDLIRRRFRPPAVPKRGFEVVFPKEPS